MPFKATLTVEGKSFNVLECMHGLTQKYERGRPTSGVHGGTIIILIDGSEEDLLGDWATGATTHKDGELVFERVDQESSLQKLEFKEAYMTMYFEFMGARTTDATALYHSMQDSISTDASTNNEFLSTLKSNRRRLLHFVERTQTSSCILMRLSAATIKLDGIEHKNT